MENARYRSIRNMENLESQTGKFDLTERAHGFKGPVPNGMACTSLQPLF